MARRRKNVVSSKIWTYVFGYLEHHFKSDTGIVYLSTETEQSCACFSNLGKRRKLYETPKSPPRGLCRLFIPTQQCSENEKSEVSSTVWTRIFKTDVLPFKLSSTYDKQVFQIHSAVCQLQNHAQKSIESTPSNLDVKNIHSLQKQAISRHEIRLSDRVVI